MSERRGIADAAELIEHPDGSRELRWRDGIARRYSMQDIATMFIAAVEKGQTNPILDRLTSPEERRFLYRELERLNADTIDVLVGLGSDTT